MKEEGGFLLKEGGAMPRKNLTWRFLFQLIKLAVRQNTGILWSFT